MSPSGAPTDRSRREQWSSYEAMPRLERSHDVSGRAVVPSMEEARGHSVWHLRLFTAAVLVFVVSAVAVAVVLSSTLSAEHAPTGSAAVGTSGVVWTWGANE